MQEKVILTLFLLIGVFASSTAEHQEHKWQFSTTPSEIIEDCTFFFDPLIRSSRYDDCRPCGDNICTCCGRRRAGPDWIPEYGDCSKPKVFPYPLGTASMTYIPKLPSTTRFLDMSVDGLVSPNTTQHFFSNITSIVFLRFAFNRFEVIHREWFTHMKNLTGLFVAGSFWTKNSLINLVSLPGLQCFAGEGMYGLSTYYKNVSSDVVFLQLNGWVGGLPFCFFHKLRYLKIRGALFGRDYVTIPCVLQLEYLKIYPNLDTLPAACTELNDSLLPNLRELDLTDNKISLIPDRVCLPNLEVLTLRQNKIQRWSKMTCNADGSQPFEVSPRIWRGPVQIEKVEEVTCYPKLRYLDLSINKMKGLPPDSRRFTRVFPRLKELNLAHNEIGGFVRTDEILPTLEILDLSSNAISYLPEASFDADRFPKLQKLRLDRQKGDSVLKINKLAFQSPSLEYLWLNDNKIRFIEPIGEVDPFSMCPRLKDLRISDINLDSLSLSKKFGQFKSMAHLELVNAELTTIAAGSFDSLTQLDVLRLSGNKLTVITEQTFGKEIRRRLKFLDLSRNPFLCTCELMWFRDWFVSNPFLFTNQPNHTVSAMDYMCINLPGKTLKDFGLTKQACLLSREVNVVIVFVCSSLIITLTVVAFVFRFRWHIRLIIYEAFKGRGDVRRQRLKDKNFDFDVFVSYASEDLPWVRQHLMAELEDHMGLRLCIHERDFIPGKNIVDNIADCVESSKKILMVFSRDFVLSHWCQFELTFCLSHVMEYEDALVVVCMDDVTSREMTSAMMAVLKTTTYIQWEDLADAVDSFWGRLRVALHEVMEAEAAV